MMRILQQALVARGSMLPQVLGLQQQTGLAGAALMSSGRSPVSIDVGLDHPRSTSTSALPAPVQGSCMLCQPRLPRHLAVTSSALLSAAAAASSGVRNAGHAAGPPVDPNRDVWAEFRATNIPDQRSSLGGGYYSLIGVFGLSILLHNLYTFPPRTIAVMALVTLLMYTRR